MQQFGDILTELREDRGVTQKQLGQILHVTGGTISNYEQGVHYPDLEKLIELADYFDVTTDYLLGRADLNISPDVFSFVLPNGNTVGQTVNQIRKLPPEVQRAILLLLDRMSGRETLS